MSSGSASGRDPAGSVRCGSKPRTANRPPPPNGTRPAARVDTGGPRRSSRSAPLPNVSSADPGPEGPPRPARSSRATNAGLAGPSPVSATGTARSPRAPRTGRGRGCGPGGCRGSRRGLPTGPGLRRDAPATRSAGAPLDVPSFSPFAPETSAAPATGRSSVLPKGTRGRNGKSGRRRSTATGSAGRGSGRRRRRADAPPPRRGSWPAASHLPRFRGGPRERVPGPDDPAPVRRPYPPLLRSSARPARRLA